MMSATSASVAITFLRVILRSFLVGCADGTTLDEPPEARPKGRQMRRKIGQ
jgi:hypothetical protein